MCEPDEFGDEPNRIVRQYHTLIRPGGRVLDLGAGGGRDTVFLARKGYRLHAVDRCPDAVAYTRRRLAEEGLHATVECADVMSLEIPDGTIDGIVMIGVVHGLRRTDAEEMFRRIGRWLAPGGVLIMTAPLNDDPRCEELRNADVPEQSLSGFEVEPGQFACYYPPGSLPDYFPGWHVRHHEEKTGIAHRVCLLVVQKPGKTAGSAYRAPTGDDDGDRRL